MITRKKRKLPKNGALSRSRGAGMLLFASVLVLLSWAMQTIAAEPDWRYEFDAICSDTESSLELETAALKQLVVRARLLEPRIAQVRGPAGRVYGKRLKMCRDLLQFVLESRESRQAEEVPGRAEGNSPGK